MNELGTEYACELAATTGDQPIKLNQEDRSREGDEYLFFCATERG